MEIKDANFGRVRDEAETWYETVDQVVCPYFGDAEPVSFNSKGLKHIKFKSDKKARSRSDQFMRLKHIRFAKRILEKSRTMQEFKEGKVFEQVKSGKSKEKKLLDVKYFGFTAIITDNRRMKRLKVVVKQVAGGEKYFWSLIPSWSSNKGLPKMHSGDPSED
jgi:hypothetical protein